MLFNSFEFAIFFPAVFIVYWSLHKFPIKVQNLFLLMASYLFYGWWDWRFLSLIIISSGVDYWTGTAIYYAQNNKSRKFFLCCSILANIGILSFFKYYNFFAGSFEALLRSFGLSPDIRTIQLILPVGISFYTFQTMSYSLDIYRRRMAPTSDIIAFFAYVSFFPQLVAGPIERAQSLLLQFLHKRKFVLCSAKDGLRQILWGLFKKIVIADTLSGYVERIYSNYTEYNSLTLLVGTFLFATQIYCDFSGYSDIAIGTARLLGFQLMRNFAYPYFSQNIQEFWKNWHISLSSWFRDYVYIPLGGSRVTKTGYHYRNITVTFALSGLWHGAKWTFVIWGVLHSFFYIVSMIFRQHTKEISIDRKLLPSAFKKAASMALTFAATLFAWIFFRADTVRHAFGFIQHMFTSNWFMLPLYKKASIYVCIFFMIEWLQRNKQHGLQVESLPTMVRWCVYYALVGAIFFFRSVEYEPFIYFQF